METPYTTHLSTADFEHVYEPAEDSFLLIDALESDLEWLRKQRPAVIVEIGPGSGVVITAVARSLPDSACMAVDINAYACRATRRTAERNSANVHICNGDLMSAFRRERLVDVLIFNPPYVLTEEEEIPKSAGNAVDEKRMVVVEGHYKSTAFNDAIVKSWAGGVDGCTIINRFLLQLDETLSENGCAYLLVIKDNNPKRIVSALKQLHFNGKIIAERKIRGEHLMVLKIVRLKSE